MNDIAIEYNAQLIQVNSSIEGLEKLGINANEWKVKIENIKETTEQEVKHCYEGFKKNDADMFIQSSIVGFYSKAAQELGKINQSIITEYEEYYQIQAKTERVTKQANDKKKDIKALNREAKELLKSIRTSSTIDYEREKNIVEKVYQLVYQIIKLELIHTNESNLLEYVQTDSTNATYISKLINEDISRLRQENSISEFADKMQELENRGLDITNVLDKELILLLCVALNQDDIRQAGTDFLEKVEMYEEKKEKIADLGFQEEELENALVKVKKDYRKLSRRQFGKRIWMTVHATLIGASIIVAGAATRENLKVKEYETITTIYDTSKEEEEVLPPEYKAEQPTEVSLVEYAPWNTPGYFREEYTRNYYIYNLYSLEGAYENPEDYLNTELKDKITYTKYEEVRSENPEEDYLENKYVITITTQNKDKYNEVDTIKTWLCILAQTCMIISLDMLARYRGKEKLKLRTLKEIEELKQENKKAIKQNKEELIELKNDLTNLTLELNEFYNELTKQYQTLPSILQKDKEIKTKKLLLERKEED